MEGAWREARSRLARGALVAYVAAIAAAHAAGASAGAAPLEINGFIGGAPGTAGGEFLQPTDVAIYRGAADDHEDDKILVTEGLGRNSRVQRLDANGNFELAWGRDAIAPGAAGDTGTGYEVCRHAGACQAAAGGSGDGELSEPSGVAVSPATGDVYVVDSGNRRVQQFTLDGELVRAWTLEIGDASDGGFADAPIAVAPTEPHHVFVGDEHANRVLEFDADGGFQRAWGWGVATGADGLEVCDDADECRAGAAPPGPRSADLTWPRHLAVDGDGVVYGSFFLGTLFDGSSEVRTRIVRFASGAAPDGPDAGEALLRPLSPEAGSAFGSSDGEAELTNGATLGLDVDARDRRLLAVNNPFGTSELDVVANPGAGAGGEGRGSAEPRVRVSPAGTLPFLQNVTGMAVGDGIVLLSSGTVEQLTGRSTFTGCAYDAERDCHGLIVLARGGGAAAVPPGTSEAVPAASPAAFAPGALIDPHGTARYRFQVTDDGRHWRDIGGSRYVTGSRYRPLPAPMRDLPPGRVWRMRVVATKITEAGRVSTTSGERFVMSDGE